MNTKKLIDTIVVTGCAVYATAMACEYSRYRARKERKKLWNNFINVSTYIFKDESEPK